MRGAAALALAFLTLAGCEGAAHRMPEPTGTLKVFDEEEDRFRAEMLPYVAASFPELEVVLLPYEAFASEKRSGGETKKEAIDNAFMAEYVPDVVIARHASSFRSLLRNNWLKPLDLWMQESDDAPDLVSPRLEEALRGDDGLQYALAPSFTARVLFYHQGLFEEAGVPLPVDGMTWEEALGLAARIASGGDGEGADIRFGLYHESSDQPFAVIVDVAGRSGGTFVDADGAPSLRTPVWRAAWELVADAYRNGGIYRSSSDGSGGGDPFLAFAEGRIGMLLGDETTARRLSGLSVPWGVVTEPIDASRPDVSPSLRLHSYLSVNQRGARQEVAWEVVRRLGGGGTVGAGIPVERAAAKRLYGDMDLEPFYRLGPDVEASTSDAAALPSAFYMAMFVDGNRLAKEVIARRLSVERALEELETSAQAALLSSHRAAGSGLQ